MNTNYHYYTVRTLAHYAGFDSKTAQFIAYFSQHIDDFILSSPFIVGTKPPDFFLDNNLALSMDGDKWVFMPCPTGINILSSVSHNNQLHTLMPFHFIMPVPYKELLSNPDRSLYRCAPAIQDDSFLINRLMEQRVNEADINNIYTCMALGMLVHTYADTFAHCGFSGFHGWENETYVSKMEHRLPKQKCNFIAESLKSAQEKLLSKQSPYDGMTPVEIAFFRTLPSIGHGNVSSAPDYCECTISLYGKKKKDGSMEPVIERNNREFFAICSRRILDMFCKVNKNPPFEDKEWNNLQERLSEAQNVREQDKDKENLKKWQTVFPEIKYYYNKKDFMDIKFEILHYDKKITNDLEVSKDDLLDIYSEQGNQARASSLLYAKNVSETFYKYNEFAYKHVNAAAGEYASAGTIAWLSDYRKLATSTKL
jgi:hypothetical protein